MPSLVSTLVRTQMNLINPLINSMGLDQSRKLQDGLAKLGNGPLTASVRFTGV